MALFSVIQPIHLLAKLFGQWAFTYDDELYYKSATSKLIDRGIALIAVIANVIILGTFLKFSATPGNSTFLTDVGSSAYPWSLIFECIAILLTITANWLLRGRILNLLHKLDKCDALFATLDLSISSKYQGRCALHLTAFVTTITILVGGITGVIATIFYVGEEDEVLMTSVCLLYLSMASNAYFAVVVFFIRVISLRFRVLNNKLYHHYMMHSKYGAAEDKAMLLERRNVVIELLSIPVDQHPSQQELAKRFANIHHYLSDIVDLLNACFSFQLMLVMTSYFTNVLLSAYFCYEAVTEVPDPYMVLGNELLWMLFHIVMITMVIYSSSSMTREARKTAQVLHKVINCGQYPEAISELRNFSQQLFHRIPVVSCGLFSFDWNLYCTIIGAFVTYLILLIQFNASSGKKKESSTLKHR